MEKLKVGEQYLSISLLGSINVTAFKNKAKKNPKEPDFKGNGIAIWVKKKKPEALPEQPVTETELVA